MIHTTYVCDGCGRRLEAPHTKIPDELQDWLIVGRRRVIPRPDEIGLPELHLCGVCLDKNPIRAVDPA